MYLLPDRRYALKKAEAIAPAFMIYKVYNYLIITLNDVLLDLIWALKP